MDYIVHGVTKSPTQLSDFAIMYQVLHFLVSLQVPNKLTPFPEHSRSSVQEQLSCSLMCAVVAMSVEGRFVKEILEREQPNSWQN